MTCAPHLALIMMAPGKRRWNSCSQHLWPSSGRRPTPRSIGQSLPTSSNKNCARSAARPRWEGDEFDKLAKVWRQDGGETWVLVHVEIQNDAETDFAERMYVYNYRIYDRHRQRVASLAVLTDQSDIWRPDRFEYELWDSQVDFRYHMVKLRDYRERWDELEASTNPFAIVVMAHLLTQDTQHDPSARYAAKRTLLKQLYRSGLAREQILALLRFIDWIMQLPEGLEDQLWQEVQSAEEETRMTRLSYIERKSIERGLETGLQQGLQQGRQEGLEEGERRGLLTAIALGLELRFGAEGVRFYPIVEPVADNERLRLICASLRTAATLAEVAEAAGIVSKN